MEEVATAAPVWRLIAEHAGDGLEQGSVARIVRLRDDEWREELASAMSLSGPGDLILVAVDAGLARAVLGFLAHGVWRRSATPSMSEVAGFLRSSGMKLEHRYALWPSSDKVRVALPATSRVGVKWVQRSGVLGGGGRRVWARALARSFLFTPLARRLAPASAWAGRVTNGDPGFRPHEDVGEDES